MEISYNILCEKNPFLKELQNTFQNLHFDTALAGGCLRDTLLDKPIDDYDVWYCGNFPLNQLAALGFEFTPLPANPYPEGEWKLTHNAVWQGRKIQFLKCKDSPTRHSIINKFPNSIGKLVMYWEHVDIIGVEAFKKSVKNKTIVWDGVYVDPKYLGKIVKKYLNWTHEYKVGFTQEKPEDATPGFWDTDDGFAVPSKTEFTFKAPEPKKYRILNASKELYKEKVMW